MIETYPNCRQGDICRPIYGPPAINTKTGVKAALYSPHLIKITRVIYYGSTTGTITKVAHFETLDGRFCWTDSTRVGCLPRKGLSS